MDPTVEDVNCPVESNSRETQSEVEKNLESDALKETEISNQTDLDVVKEEILSNEIFSQELVIEEAKDSNIIEASCSNPSEDVAVTHNSVSNPKRSTSTEDLQNSIYHIKWISQDGIKTPIVTQNENGPCPLIAIINVLILKGRVKLPLLVDIVTSEKLMEYLGDCILESIPKNIPEGAQLNYEQNIHDAMAILPKLQTGLDVNVKFTGISDFEYTPECVVFDLLRIPLCHGWLVDPEIPDVQKSVGTCSYNQLVEKIINCKSSSDQEKIIEGLVAESFLEKTASQLTYHGLCELNASLKDEELCILFRNNHFTLLLKHKNQLYQLVTDQGFLVESNVVWETLNNIEGDGQFVDSNFVLVPPKPLDSMLIPPELAKGQQIDQDYLIALSLQEEQQKQKNSDLEWEEYKKQNLRITGGLTDEDLAHRLQEVEHESRPREDLNHQFQHHPQQPVPTNNTRSRSRDCAIL